MGQGGIEKGGLPLPRLLPDRGDLPLPIGQAGGQVRIFHDPDHGFAPGQDIHRR